MYYFGYRYYAPEVGRWLSRDPVQVETLSHAVDLLTVYALVANNVVNAQDPHGLVAWTTPGSPVTPGDPDTAFWVPWPAAVGKERYATTDAGTPFAVWRPNVLTETPPYVYASRNLDYRYNCHSFTFRGKEAGFFTPLAGFVPLLLRDEWRQVACCMASPDRDIVVFFKPGEPPPHSARVQTVVVSAGVFDETNSRVVSKRGNDRGEWPWSFFREYRMYAADDGHYGCFQRKGAEPLHGCCAPGPHEKWD